jgi:hypothetical protein
VNLRKTFKITIGALAICAILCAIISPPFGYFRFLMRGQDYYSGIADDCRKFFVDVGREGENVIDIDGNDQLLPAGIRALDPTRTSITPKGVAILIGHGMQAYHVIWGKNQNDASEELRVTRERAEKLVYTRKNVQ